MRSADRNAMVAVPEPPVFVTSLREWDGDNFARVLKQEIEALPSGTLPLQAGVAQGGMADDAGLTAMVLRSRDAGSTVEAVVGIFFAEVVAGCSCGDEPMALNAYCELQISIDKQTGRGGFKLLAR
jgi:hypothetical protein